MELPKTKYEIRNNGATMGCFNEPGMYTTEQLRRMEADGYLLYTDGKRTPVRSRKKTDE